MKYYYSSCKTSGVGVPKTRKKGFTLVEVLLTVIIVGVVATLTIPSIAKNIKRYIIEKQLISAVSMIYNVIRSSEVENGPIKNWDLTSYAVSGDPNNFDYETPRINLFNKYFMPYMKTKNEDASLRTTPRQIGYKTAIKQASGEQLIGLDSSFMPILMDNGMILFHNTGSLTKNNVKTLRWLHLYIDINGTGGDNAIGKDIHVFYIPLMTGYGLSAPGEYSSFNSNTNTYYQQYSESELNSKCRAGGSNSKFCLYQIKKNGWKIPKDYPWL